MDMVQTFWVNITPQLHVVFFRLAYKSRASKNKNWRGRNFKTYKKYFKNNDEKLEHLNSFQKFIFNQQSTARGGTKLPAFHLFYHMVLRQEGSKAFCIIQKFIITPKLPNICK